MFSPLPPLSSSSSLPFKFHTHHDAISNVIDLNINVPYVFPSWDYCPISQSHSDWPWHIFILNLLLLDTDSSQHCSLTQLILLSSSFLHICYGSSHFSDANSNMLKPHIQFDINLSTNLKMFPIFIYVLLVMVLTASYVHLVEAFQQPAFITATSPELAFSSLLKHLFFSRTHRWQRAASVSVVVISLIK